MVDFTVLQKSKDDLKIRESGVEILRILSIFFVIVIHEIPVFLDQSNLFVVIGRIIAWPAIFSFAFVTGYYLIVKENSENKISRFLWLTLEIVIWRILIAFLFLFGVALAEHYSVAQFFGNFFGDIILDLFNYKAWYFWAIIFVYLVFPFFSNYLKTNYDTGKKLLKWLLIFLLFISFLATVAFLLVDALGYNFSLYTDPYTIFTVLLAATLGAFWHLIEKEKRIQYNYKLQLIGLAGLLIVYMINFSFIWWVKNSNAGLTYLNIFWYFAGGFYFLIFKGFKFHSWIINWWSNLSWWIYLIHNGSFLPRGWAVRIMRTVNIDLYSATVLAILICYLITIALVILVRNIDRFIIKPYVIENIKITIAKRKLKKEIKTVK